MRSTDKKNKAKKKVKLKVFFSSAIALACCAVFFPFVFSSCASKMSDEEAQRILTELVPKSEELNKIFWGEGLPVEDETNEALNSVTSAQYRAVAQACEYKSIEDIKKSAESVFSSDYLNQVYAVAFGEYEDQTQNNGEEETGTVDAEELGLNTLNARYIEENGVLYKDITYAEYTLSTDIDEMSAEVVKRGMGIIVCRVDCTVGGEKKTMEITLRNENDIWLIDSPTY